LLESTSIVIIWSMQRVRSIISQIRFCFYNKDLLFMIIRDISGGRSPTLLIQKIGRGLRKAKDKHKLEYHDFFFMNNTHLKNHSQIRMNTLRKEGHKVTSHFWIFKGEQERREKREERGQMMNEKVDSCFVCVCVCVCVPIVNKHNHQNEHDHTAHWHLIDVCLCEPCSRSRLWLGEWALRCVGGWVRGGFFENGETFCQLTAPSFWSLF
jgi:hypothetical protein